MQNITTWLSTHHALVVASWLVFSAVVVAIFKPRTGEAEAAFEAAWPRLAAFVKAVDALGIDPVQLITSIGKLAKGAPKGPLVLVLAIAVTTQACKTPSVPQGGDADASGPTVVQVLEAGAPVVTDVCTLLEGIDDSGVLRTICATVEEVAQVVSFILTLRSADAGPPADAACTPITAPGAYVCATKAEIAKGVLWLTQQRAARLTRDR